MRTTRKGIFFTDFDGTLLRNRSAIMAADVSALKKAREAGFTAVIATGRSLYSLQKALLKVSPEPLAGYVDYVIFSSGAGLAAAAGSESGMDVLEAINLAHEAAENAGNALCRLGLDFMIHDAVPENHRMTYYKISGTLNPDFYRRIELYKDFSRASGSWTPETEGGLFRIYPAAPAAQLLAVAPPSGAPVQQEALFARVRGELPGLSVIRTTSPIDGKSMWIEIFDGLVSKSLAASRLADRLGVKRTECYAVGNDFNDEDLLAWAAASWTAADSPEDLRRRFPSAGSKTGLPVSEALSELLE